MVLAAQLCHGYLLGFFRVVGVDDPLCRKTILNLVWFYAVGISGIVENH